MSTESQAMLPPAGPLATGAHYIGGAPEGQDARILASRARDAAAEGAVCLHVATDETRISTLLELLGFFAPDIEILTFPAWDCLPYDRVSPNPDIVMRRVDTLARLESRAAGGTGGARPLIVLTSVNAVLQKIMPRHSLKYSRLKLAQGERLDAAQLTGFLQINGYNRTDTVREAGEYAMRGGIIDLFPPGQELPLRVDLFGDEIEQIRYFDPATQRSGAAAQDICLLPAQEFFLDEASVARFRSAYRAAFGAVREDDPLYAAVTAARRHAGMEHWMPLFHEGMESFFDYVPGAQITMDYQAAEAAQARLAQVEDFYEARKTLQDAARRGVKAGKKDQDVSLSGAIYHPLPPGALYLPAQEWEKTRAAAAVFNPFAGEDTSGSGMGARKGRNFADVRAVPGSDIFAAVRDYAAGLSVPVLIACYSEGSRERIRGLLADVGVKTVKICNDERDWRGARPGEMGLAVLALENGFAANDLCVLSEQDILGDRLARKGRKRRRADNFLTEVSSLNEGDLVVHVDHGVGRFISLETVNVGKTRHDCLKIEYAGGDRLFVPVENMEVLSRFGSEESGAALDKLGGAGWQARKARVKKDLMALAEHLLGIAAARKLQRAARLQAEGHEFQQFVSGFPYQETEDQERAIADVLEDLGRDYPMDRLICGDVGFGKTEVAMRAAYAAAMHGAQVAVAVPTTLLARQHYKNFTQRFEGTGLRVAQLSRMVSARETAQTKKAMAEGGVHIVIGTHALFAKDVRFANLGLLVVDEEQRFGVKQKERLKEIRNNVHVLTLSATPIPRTLQMALSGVREMSIIATPPVDRLAVRTFILPFDPLVVREALMREHYRGGQSFYVCPRVKDITEVEEMLRDLVPEIKVVSAHGQMSPADLEDRMSAFYEGRYGILLATNIIESGIDIPSANTMVIHRADMFGLSQLYQIRGRIGRSKLRGYAYLTHAPGAMLSPPAMKRLEVMETLDTLGAGFQLASHDMDIRGAGNLLGEQQSGHIREVGVELYQQMLEEAVADARAGADAAAQREEVWSPQINIGMSVLIPDSYVPELPLRMSLYRRLSDLQGDSDIEAFAAELIDRFGPLPGEVENLLEIVRIKALCRRAHVAQMEAGPKGAVIGFHMDRPPAIEPLMAWIAGKSGTVKLRPDQKLVVMRVWDTPAQRLKGAASLMREIASLFTAAPLPG